MGFSIIDYMDDGDAADAVTLWLARLVDDEGVSDEVQDAASVAFDRVNELLTLMELVA